MDANLSLDLVRRLVLPQSLEGSLTHHAVAEVVQHHHLDREVVGRDRFQFAEVHAHTGIAIDIDDQTVRMRELRTDGRHRRIGLKRQVRRIAAGAGVSGAGCWSIRNGPGRN